ncbi:hypothetical protein ASC92_25845 [Variovorax sp. Root411]|nr:hypothetical protein ASC92_25845 [Variovorax sp. Root411]
MHTLLDCVESCRHPWRLVDLTSDFEVLAIESDRPLSESAVQDTMVSCTAGALLVTEAAIPVPCVHGNQRSWRAGFE